MVHKASPALVLPPDSHAVNISAYVFPSQNLAQRQ